jgi:hypothetical protein
VEINNATNPLILKHLLLALRSLLKLVDKEQRASTIEKSLLPLVFDDIKGATDVQKMIIMINFLG